MVKPMLLLIALIAAGTLILGGSGRDIPRERIIIHPRYEWEQCCAVCGRRNGEDGVQNHYCQHCHYAFRLRAIPDPW